MHHKNFSSFGAMLITRKCTQICYDNYFTKKKKYLDFFPFFFSRQYREEEEEKDDAPAYARNFFAKNFNFLITLLILNFF